MDLHVTGEVLYWPGPSPHYFLPITGPQADEVADVARDLTYGWGCIPVDVTMGDVTWSTSLMPKDGGYLVPIRKAMREVAGLTEGDKASMTVTLGGPSPRMSPSRHE
ncbi:MAG: DUF1905 domain-containing protein [Candidatus Nanopelagicales bacterium]